MRKVMGSVFGGQAFLIVVIWRGLHGLHGFCWFGGALEDGGQLMPVFIDSPLGLEITKIYSHFADYWDQEACDPLFTLVWKWRMIL